jgi:adenylate cyclase
MEFSCIGDAVNLASRTEGLTKFYGLTILITEYTLRETQNLFITREIEQVIVTGKKQCCRMYELIGKKGYTISGDVLQTLDLYAQGLQMYKERMFDEAMEYFSTAISLTDDGPSHVLNERCKHFIKNPPPENWDGVYAAIGK